jgi:UDP:flavonoid glycosyltransferase YjiC (YdhE family)
MGSMVTFDVGRLLHTVTESLEQTGQRGVVVGAWSEIAGRDLDGGQVLGIDAAPYDWLFPKAACVIHHGGCGTVAAVLRAGIPSIVLPQVTCQEHFGWLLGRNGLATGMFDSSALDAETLAEAIDSAVTDAAFRKNAKSWRDVLAQDRGVSEAADLIEAFEKSGRK